MASKEVLREKIKELEKMRAMAGSLSPVNALILEQYRLNVEFHGRDIMLVVQSSGALRPGQKQTAKIVEVIAANAAKMLKNPNAGETQVRLAKPKEIEAYRDYNTTLTLRAKQQITDNAMKAATAQINAVMGVSAVAEATGASDAPPEPVAETIVEETGIEGPATPGGDVLVETEEGAGETPLSDAVLDLLGDEQEVNLRAAGYATLETLADADPKYLEKAVSGVGKATAAKLITAAAEGLAEATDDAVDAE